MYPPFSNTIASVPAEGNLMSNSVKSVCRSTFFVAGSTEWRLNRMSFPRSEMK